MRVGGWNKGIFKEKKGLHIKKKGICEKRRLNHKKRRIEEGFINLSKKEGNRHKKIRFYTFLKKRRMKEKRRIKEGNSPSVNFSRFLFSRFWTIFQEWGMTS